MNQRAATARQDAEPLLSPAGQELLARLAGEEVTPDRALALSAELRGQYQAGLVAAALTQQSLRVSALAKFGLAGQMLFTRAGLEQASSELTARHAAARFAGAGVVADMCCGIGGNLAALAALPGIKVAGADADLTTARFASHNAAIAGQAGRARCVRVVCADVTTLPVTGLDAVFIDPARRDAGRRLPAGQYRPPLAWCLALAEPVPRVGIKAAPGLRRDLVPPGWETEFVAAGRELKEALVWSPALAGPGVTSRATILQPGGGLSFSLTGPAKPAPHAVRPAAPPGTYLLDPNPAVTRAGLVTELAGTLGAWQIDPMIAFLSSDELVRTPFARTLLVLESAPWHEKRFAARLRELGIGSADIRRRGLAGDVAQIHRRLGLRGEGAAATVVMTRVNDRPWGLICADPAQAEPGRGQRADA